MRPSLFALALLGLAAPAAAQEHAVSDFATVRAACDAAREGTHDALYVVELPSGWRFAPHEPGELGLEGEGVAHLWVDTRRNLRALSGRVELMPTHLERVGFVASESRAGELEAARAAGAHLRIGFFLGFDDPDGSPCVLRPAAVSVLRIDVAFVELVEASGAVVAREDTDRYAAWSDDAARDSVPGSGPRAAVGAASAVEGGTMPTSWSSALSDASAGAIGMALSACHRAGIERGAPGEGMVRVRVSVDAGSGRVTESRVEITDIGDGEETSCVADAFRGVAFPAAPGAGRTVELSVPVRLVD